MEIGMSKRRFSVTLGEPFQKALDLLVEQEIYVDHQDVIRESLRDTFEKYGIDPFWGVG